MRVLVLGAGGQIGRAVEASAPLQHRVLTRTRAQLDICDAAAVARTLGEVRADWIINGAAYTSVDLAEDQPQQAMAANDLGVGILSKAALQVGCRLLHLSTDFVFDGNLNRAYLPTDPTNPLSIYGLSKLAGERHVSLNEGGVILRTSWVYAAQGRNFVLTMLKLMREKDRVSVVSDQIGAPTWAASVALAIWACVGTGVPGGIYHWTDLGVASWYDFAVAIQDEALARGLLPRAVPIVPISSAAYPTRAKRPAFSVLDSSSARAALHMPGTHWRHNLRMLMDELRAP